jgi:hypothetical protein
MHPEEIGSEMVIKRAILIRPADAVHIQGEQGNHVERQL